MPRMRKTSESAPDALVQLKASIDESISRFREADFSSHELRTVARARSRFEDENVWTPVTGELRRRGLR